MRVEVFETELALIESKPAPLCSPACVLEKGHRDCPPWLQIPCWAASPVDVETAAQIQFRPAPKRQPDIGSAAVPVVAVTRIGVCAVLRHKVWNAGAQA